MIARATAVRIAAVIAVAAVAGVVAARWLAPDPGVAPSPRLDITGPSPAGPGPAGPVIRWLVDVGPGAAVPDRIVYPPAVAGDRVLVAGARIGYVALDRARGQVAWRRAAGAELAPPLVRSAHDAVLVHDCDPVVGAAVGRAVIGCFERIDPTDIAARAAGGIHAAEADVAPCVATMAPWQLTEVGGELRLDRPGCALVFAIPDGAARAVAPKASLPVDDPDDPDCARLVDGTRWCQRVAGGRSTVELDELRAPGLSILAAARDGDRAALVVRRDSTLRHDELVALRGGAIAWTWPLPEPADGRATPVAVALIDDTIYVVFDSSRVAALAAP